MAIRPVDHGIISAAGVAGGLTLSGGTAFTVGSDSFMKFTSSGTLTVAGSGKVDYVVVGGGGAGGYNQNYSNGSGGGGGGGGIAWGSNYLLDASVKSSFAIVIGAGGAGNQLAQGGYGGGSRITDWGIANDTSNFDWTGGTTYSNTANDIYAAGGGGGGKGDWAVNNSGNVGRFANYSDPSPGAGSDDWGSGGSGGGGGGWDGYAGGAGNYGGNSWINTGLDENINTIKAENSDGTIATHYVSGRNGPPSNGGTQGNAARTTLDGTVSSTTFPTGQSNSGDLTSTNRGWEWHDGVRYGAPGAGGRGNWYNSADGGGRGSNQGGPLDALDNQGGGGGGGGSEGGDGGSGIVIFRIIV